MTLIPKKSETTHCQPPAGPPPQLLLTGAPESVRIARAWVREFTGYHLPEATEERVDDVQLIVSELVTNSVRYGTEPGDSVLVVLAATAKHLRIEVHDPVRRRPHLKRATAQAVRGRGLFIVDTLAERWGVDDRPCGKTTWAEVSR
jgi:anti-sigma regulatory factor (Ser/Thr protein kinase)